MNISSNTKEQLRCKDCGFVQAEGAWEDAMDRQSKAMGGGGFVNINAEPQCLRCGKTCLGEVQSVQFEGKTVKEAQAAAAAAVFASFIYASKVTRTMEEVIAEGEGEDANTAIEAAKARVKALDAFDVSPAEIIQIAEKGLVDVEAQTEMEVRKNLMALPRGATLEKLDCVISPEGGFLGIGKKKGLWKVYWSKLYKARISYKLPAQITVWYSV